MNLFASLRGYRPASVPTDLIAGVMLAAIAIPEQLATAKLAGFAPTAGLIAFVCAGLAFAVFGRNRFLSVGADSTIAPIFAGTLGAIAASGSAEYTELASAAALAAGALLIAAGLARAGWLADLLSQPVTTGFLAGISIRIVVGQVPSLLGIEAAHGSLWSQIAGIAAQLAHINVYTLAIGVAVFAVTIGASRVSERIPGALIGLAGAGLTFALLHLDMHGVSAVGALAVTVPHVALPALRDPQQFLTILPLAFVLAAVCMMQSSAVISSFPSDPGIVEDVSRDFAAVGAGSVLSGLFGSFAVDASPPRTAVVAESGGRSQLSSLTAVAIVIAMAAFFSGLAAYIPEAALAGVLTFVALRIFRLNDMVRIARFSRREFQLMLGAAVMVVALPIQEGMLLAIILSLVHGIFLIMRPLSTKLVRRDNSTVWWPPVPGVQGSEVPGVLVFAPAAPINFTNANYVRTKLYAAIQSEPPPVKLVVIEASGVTDFDYTGSQMFEQTIDDLRDHGTDVAVARLLSEYAEQRMEKNGLRDTIGEDHIFPTVQEAIDALMK
jgi:MFS superfamily sulfate permease-like transporter